MVQEEVDAIYFNEHFVQDQTKWTTLYKSLPVCAEYWQWQLARNYQATRNTCDHIGASKITEQWHHHATKGELHKSGDSKDTYSQIMCWIYFIPLGIVRMKQLARLYVWWPSINQDIGKTRQSSLCLLSADSQWFSTDIPTATGHRQKNHGSEFMWISQDLSWRGCGYCVSDSYIKYQPLQMCLTFGKKQLRMPQY